MDAKSKREETAEALLRELLAEARSLFESLDDCRGPLDGPDDLFKRVDAFLTPVVVEDLDGELG